MQNIKKTFVSKRRNIGDKILLKKYVHLGVAVAILKPDPGLLVPIIHNCDQLNLLGIAKSLHQVINKVKQKKIINKDLIGGTFTITNPGIYGSLIGTPIINQPQVAILGVGSIRKEIKVITMGTGEAIAIRPIGWLSLSFDHRLVDGATADLFMSDLKKELENFSSSALDL